MCDRLNELTPIMNDGNYSNIISVDWICILERNILFRKDWKEIKLINGGGKSYEKSMYIFY